MFSAVCEFIFSVVIFFISLHYAYSEYYIYFYWKKRNVPFIRPKYPYGNLGSLRGNEPFCQYLQRFYHKFKDNSKYFGLFSFSRPTVIITDFQLAESILITDFSSFNDRSMYHNERDDPLSGQMVLFPGEKARKMRQHITPAFTPIRMKDMFKTLIAVTDRLKEYLKDILNKNNELNISEILARYTIDVIGAAAFGIECNSLENPDNEFHKMCTIHLSKKRHGSKRQFFLNYNQKLCRWFGVKLIRDDVSDFFLKIVQKTIMKRESTNVRKSDFMDLLVDIRRDLRNQLTMKELSAQAFAFFTPGYDTISTAMTFMLYEIAKNPHIQSRLRREIENIVGYGNENLTYETVGRMPFLNQIILETMRKYPPFTMLRRIAVKDYNIPGTDHTLKAGTPVFIPVYSFHHDPELFPKPDDFDPERFADDENAKKRMLAFGLGPRNCIGARFSTMQLSIALIMFIRNFQLSLSNRTISPLEFKRSAVRLAPKDKIYLNLNALQ